MVGYALWNAAGTYEFGGIGRANTSSEYFVNSAANDICIRNCTNNSRILMGVTSSADLIITSSDLTFLKPITCGTLNGGLITGGTLRTVSHVTPDRTGLQLMWDYTPTGIGNGFIINARGAGVGGIEIGSWYDHFDDNPPSGLPSEYICQLKLGHHNNSGSLGRYTGLWLPRLFSGAGDYPLKWTSVDGGVTYETSARRFKQDIAPYTDDGLLYKVDPVYYRYKSDPARLQVGLIADDLVQIDTSNMYVIYDKDNQPEGIRYDKFITPLIACVQSQNKEIKEMQAQIAELRALITK
jgi:hypothetical protein